MKKVAVLLSGCGVFDGAEIQESVLSLYFLNREGAKYQCFAPDIPQLHVVNHLTGEEADEHRNVLVESARIARGDVKPLSELDVNDFDALLVPGGFGAAKNLCDFALKGPEASIEASVLIACREFAQASKPAAYLCIAPALIPLIYDVEAEITIGDDDETAAALELMGATHKDARVDEIVVDNEKKLVTTPAYMLAQDIGQAASGIEKLVQRLVEMA